MPTANAGFGIQTPFSCCVEGARKGGQSQYARQRNKRKAAQQRWVCIEQLHESHSGGYKNELWNIGLSCVVWRLRQPTAACHKTRCGIKFKLNNLAQCEGCNASNEFLHALVLANGGGALADVLIYFGNLFYVRPIETITKLEAAQRHLDIAIRLFFEDRDVLAIHTLAAAAQGILRDIARDSGAEHQSILHDNPCISTEHRREWIAAINAPRNFFKHADKDPNGVLEFEPAENERLLLDSVLLYSTVADEGLSSASVYIGWFTTKNAQLRGAISGNQIGEYAVRNHISPKDKPRWLEIIDANILIDPA